MMRFVVIGNLRGKVEPPEPLDNMNTIEVNRAIRAESERAEAREAMRLDTQFIQRERDQRLDAEERYGWKPIRCKVGRPITGSKSVRAKEIEYTIRHAYSGAGGLK